eukprot:gb/GEZN01003514.1/.p1 GENE.gb/GEZN01003514.1/~~gb/GEZN01003514.1/.p1  ORF type:complete len:711 (-),score=79.39 gb/GEZN01003514.1/:23-1897(-)
MSPENVPRSVSVLAGNIELNGHRQTKKDKRKLGFVFQNDMLLSDLTVRETMTFAARLRLPPVFSRSDINKMVVETATKLGIEKLLERRVGYGLSGGEKKRLSIAVELIAQPKILYCDEPTSGLDATTALKLIKNLKQLCSRSATDRAAQKVPMTVIASIHQPRETIFAQFDKLLLLSSGAVVYFGPANRAISYFSSIGQPLPPFTNPADFFLDVINTSERGEVFQGSKEHVNLEEAWQQRSVAIGAASPKLEIKEADFSPVSEFVSPGTAFVDFAKSMESTSSLPSVATSPAVRLENLAQNTPVSPMLAQSILAQKPVFLGSEGQHIKSMREIWDEDAQIQGDYASSWCTQFVVLWERSVKQTRGSVFNKINIVSVILMAIIASFVWWQTENIQDTIGLLFFILLQQSFDNLLATTRFFPPERALMQRERSTASYRVSAYFLAKTMSDLMGVFVIPSVFAIIVYLATGLFFYVGNFFLYWFIFMSSVWCAQSMGILFSCIWTTPAIINRVVPLVMLTFMLLGGFYASAQHVPPAFAWVRYISFVYWGYGSLLVNQFAGRTFDCSMARPGEFGEQCPIQGETILAARDFADFSIGVALAVLWAMIFVYRYCGYLALRFIRKGQLA